MRKMNANFCTHFSSSYIPQGIALLLSIKKQYPDSKIWVMPLDNMTRLTLTELNIENVLILKIDDAPELFANFDYFRSVRSFAESVFSIKSQIIEYVMKKSQENEITFYLDADTFMFAPFELPANFNEASIFLSPHYFTPLSIKSVNSGKYNAGLVGFRNNNFGRAAIRHWIILCKEWCFVVPDSGRYADQKYLEEIATKWNPEVGILEYGNNFGTWSFAENLRVERRSQDIYIDDKKITLFHFHGLKISKLLLRTGISMYGHFSSEKEIKKLIYARYRVSINHTLGLLAGIKKDGIYRNEDFFPKVGGLHNFLALMRRHDFMLMTSTFFLFQKKN
jgi:hypothetical protein